MDYFFAITSALVCWIPFAIILSVLFRVIQIPFSLIHRYAVFALMLVKLFLFCSFLAFMGFYFASANDLSVIPFFIVFVPVIYLQQVGYFSKNANEATKQFGTLACGVCLPLLAVSIIFIPPFLKDFYTGYILVFHSLQTMSGLGSVSSFVFCAVGSLYLLYTIIRCVIYVFSMTHPIRR